jgi:aspartyl-tRNA(Asn)/glutamyl-tRNA(Gln) amidotransferase subunit B
MRGKEDAHDYRYFPEPDLLPLELEQTTVDALRASLPELPLQRKTRYVAEFNINEDTAHNLTEDINVANFFEETVAQGANATKTANWLTGVIAAYLNDNKVELSQTKLSSKLLAQMIALIDKGIISDNIAKNDIIIELLENGTDVEKLIADKGLAQITDSSEIENIIQTILDANPKQVADYKAGNQKIKGFFVGQVMKQTQGKASPQIINESLEKLLA